MPATAVSTLEEKERRVIIDTGMYQRRRCVSQLRAKRPLIYDHVDWESEVYARSK